MNAIGAFVAWDGRVFQPEDWARVYSGARFARFSDDGPQVELTYDSALAADKTISISSSPRLSVVADARIDSRADLCRALGIPARDAHALSAADLIGLAWARFGANAPQHLIGEYAFIIWDRHERTLSLVRDYFGLRPLHYRVVGSGLLVASVPAAIAAATGGARPNLFTLVRHHVLFPQTGPESFFEGISRVEPGTIVEWRAGRVAIRRYWQAPDRAFRISREEAAEEMRSLIAQAVEDRISGATAVAAQLSGGMDSSAVVAALGDLGVPALAVTGDTADGRDEPPPGYIASEVETAAGTVRLYPNLRHKISRPSNTSLFNLMEENNLTIDEPIRSAENLGWIEATYRDAAAHGATVLLTGDFGNNSFSYDGHGYLAELLRRGRLVRLAIEGRDFRRRFGARWSGVAAYALGPLTPEWLWRKRLGKPSREETWARTFLLRAGHPVMKELRERAKADRHDVSERPAASTRAARVPELRWVDLGLASFAKRSRWGFQISDPLSDRRLVEFSLRLRGEHWLEHGRTRAIARRVLSGRVAPEVIDPPGRGLQGSGWRAAVEESMPRLRAEARAMEQSAWGELIDVPRVNAMLDNWPTSGWSDFDQQFLYRASLIRAINYGHFVRVRGS